MKKKIILIIVDKPNEAKTLRTLLEQADYKVICTYDGNEGIKKAKLAKPDLIILDIEASEKDWFLTADGLRNDIDCCTIPTIVLTAFSDIPTSFQDGEGTSPFHMWDEYLKKPFDPDELLLHVKRILERREQVDHDTLHTKRVPNSKLSPSPSYSTIIRIEFNRKPGALGEVASAIGRVGGVIGAITIVKRSRDKTIRDITVDARDQDHEHQIASVLNNIKGVKVIEVSDLTFFSHIGGKIEVTSKIPLNGTENLSMAYTPGVARVCQAIQEDKEKAYHLTIKRHTVAIVTDGSAVLGLGDIGPEAALPVMEGKAMLFKEFGGVDAFPICLTTKDPDEIIKTTKNIASGFGGINLEDISAPRCFEIEQRLINELDIPVFHDDQHGTAVVILAALINALKVVGKKMEDLKVVVSGVGAAGVACTKILMASGVSDIIGCDRTGALYKGRNSHMNGIKEWYAGATNLEGFKGSLKDALKGADLFVGVSSAHLLTGNDIKRMAKDPIVFAMANPIPEIMPEEAQPYAKIMATGRSDYPNQINNVLCFPGLFRGALHCYARRITADMNIAAARAIADVVPEKALREDNIIPPLFDKKVADSVAQAVEKSAFQEGVARKHPDDYSFYHVA